MAMEVFGRIVGLFEAARQSLGFAPDHDQSDQQHPLGRPLLIVSGAELCKKAGGRK